MPKIVAGFTSVENRIRSFFDHQSLGLLLRQSNIRKDKGVSIDTVFQFLLALVFTGKNLFRLLESSESPEGISTPSRLKLRIQSLKFDSGFVSCELPVNIFNLVVPGCLPGVNFASYGIDVRYPAIKALPL